MSNDTYRRPIVAVIGGGAAGAAAAAECALIGFKTIIVDDRDELGGRYAGPTPEQPPKNFGYRKNNLRHTKARSTSESACEHIQAAVNFSGAEVRLNSWAEEAGFDTETGHWKVGLIAEEGSEILEADVLIIATGTGTLNEIRGADGRVFDLQSTHLHQGIEPLGLPNILVVDGPEPARRSFFDRPLDIVEARADHCQRYTRQLEVLRPGQLEVNKSYWRAAQVTRGKTVADLREFPAGTHRHTPLKQPQKKPRHDKQPSITTGEV